MYQLACENNVTTIVLDYKKYHVKAINYHNFTIRVAEVSINNNICSFPKHSLYLTNFSTFGYPYSIYRDTDKTADHEVAWPINFMSCPYPLMNSSLFTGCGRGGSSYGNGRYAYVKVGHTNVSALKVSCRVDLTVMTSWKFKDSNNVSLSEIHDSLLYGFELSWFNFDMDFAHFTLQIIWYWIRMFYFLGSSSVTALVILFLLLILIFMFAGISLAAMIIVGLLICAPVLLVITNNPTLFGYYSVVWVVLNPTLIVVLGFAARFIFGFSCLMWILIYKFRRRHMSMYDAIEGFLQSDNKLMPIRYSHSNIKRMTRGFREKVGKGGYGCVYKGKLRSGLDVAVKMLGKSTTNGQDFINEIATIGRIHHVNVVKLVGYCAERSKRALVFDFMPNGSLEKGIGVVSFKADIYSFGMLLMDIVGLKRDLITGNNNDSSKYFPYWIYDHINQGKEIEIENVGDNDNARKLVRKMIVVALWCIQMSPDDRPSMSKVLEILEGDVERLSIPDYPSQSTPILVDQTGITCSTDFVSSLLHHDDASPNVEITVQE
ncbi:PR5-like receptor kinase [Perilla frutescens var. frutescens]|nr:PR5-like receptor kinase [Perilla frutescens var. frutescens]